MHLLNLLLFFCAACYCLSACSDEAGLKKILSKSKEEAESIGYRATGHGDRGESDDLIEDKKSSAEAVGYSGESQQASHEEGEITEELADEANSLLSACQDLSYDSKIIRNNAAGQVQEQTESGEIIVEAHGSRGLIKLNAEGEGVSEALCIFVTGNQNQVEVTLNHSYNHIHVINRGNRNLVSIFVNEGYYVKAINRELKGNFSELRVDGPGSYTCEGEAVLTKKGIFDCQPTVEEVL